MKNQNKIRIRKKQKQKTRGYITNIENVFA